MSLNERPKFANFENPYTFSNSFCRFDIKSKKFIFPDNFPPRDKKYCGGVPLLYENGNVFVDTTDTHTLVFGATGSLKSRTVVMPTIKVLGYAGESMIINDSKGELYSKLAYELKNKRGYKLIVINLRNPSVSNAWNPLKIPYEFYINGDLDRASEFANDIANNLMLAEIATQDPFWDYSASDLFFGLILLLFKYCKEYNQPIEAVNIGNIIKLRQLIFEDDSPEYNRLWKYAKDDELIATSLSGAITAPTNTRNSILSVFDQKMRAFSIQPTLLNMLSDNNFDIEDITKGKTAIFLITPDEKTLYHRLVALFIKQSYEYIIYLAQKNDDYKVNNRINYVLDEYSSLPYIHDMASMISAARSRDIRFLLVIQSKKQLIQRYSEEADTIISNCTNWIFLTSRETELLQELSTLCGNDKSTGKPNITVYDLQHLSKKNCEALVLSGRLKPALNHLLDIDRYGDSESKFLDFEELPRKDRIILSFNLSSDKSPSNPDNTQADEDEEKRNEERRAYLEARRQEILRRMQAEKEENNNSENTDTTDTEESNE